MKNNFVTMNSFIKEFYNEGNKYIDWVDTKESIKARKVLESIFDFYAKDKIISNYLNENCEQFLKKPEGHTGITWEFIKPENLIKNGGVHIVMEKYTPSKFINKSGVYSVLNVDTNDNYIGSATNFRSRWEQHYQDMFGNKPSPMHKALLNAFGGSHNYTFFAVKTTTNYIYDFISKHPDYKLDGPSFRALQIMTQYECRLLEQSLITAMKPNLNINHEVIFSFKFNPENLVEDIRGSRPIIAIQKYTNIEIPFDSIRQTAKALDMDTRSIKGILNIENAFRGSRNTKDLYSFIDPSQPIKLDNRYNQILMNIEGIDYNSIPEGMVWAFDKDLNKLFEFKSRREAAKECGVSNITVMRNMNKVFTKCVHLGVAISLLFASNIKDSRVKSMPIIVHCIITEKYYYFSSLEQVKRILKLPQGGYLTKSYVDTGKSYKKQYVFYSAYKFNAIGKVIEYDTSELTLQ